MANEQPVCYRGTFQHCLIQWSVRNFTLLSCADEYELSGPDFCVYYPSATRWKLGLRSTCTGELGNLSIFLERLETGRGPETVLVNWRAALLNYEKVECFSAQYECLFKERKQVELEFLGYPDIHKVIPDNIPDTVEIHCDLIINHDLGSENLHDPELDPSLRSMSQDFARLYKRSTFHDLVLKTGPLFFRTHRAILSTRNKVMYGLIKNADCNFIEFPDEFADAMGSVLCYLYTGDINHIVRRPTVSLMRLTEYLSMEEIKKSFTRHHFRMQSKVESNEYEFCWNIENFRDIVSDHIISPRYFDILERNRIWQLHLFPKGLNGDSSSMDLVLEYVCGTKTLDVSVIYVVSDLSHAPLREVRDYRRIQVTESVFTFNFFPRDYLDETLKHGLFTILCTIQVSENETVSRLLEEMERRNPPPMPISLFYSGLALNVRKACCRNIYADVVLAAQGKAFSAHKCILASRSKTFYNILKRETRTVVNLDMRHIILAMLLKYLYGEDIERPGINVIKRLYEAALVFGIPSLTALCSKYLRSLFAADTIGDIMEFAEDNQDEELKAAVVNYISESQNRNDQGEANQE